MRISVYNQFSGTLSGNKVVTKSKCKYSFKGENKLDIF